MTIEVPKAQPEELLKVLNNYDRVTRTRRSGAYITTHTAIHDGLSYPVSRVCRDLNSTVDIIGLGYIIVDVRPTINWWRDDIDTNEPTDIHAISFRPLSELLVYSQFGYYTHDGVHIESPPTMP